RPKKDLRVAESARGQDDLGGPNLSLLPLILTLDLDVGGPIAQTVDFPVGKNLESLLSSPANRGHQRALLGVAGAAPQADDAIGALLELAVMLRAVKRLPAVTFAVERLRED